MPLEVLSPAGNMDALIAAVRSGADAVYIGSQRFSARKNAANFDDEQLKNAVNYCHSAGVKVYLTLNTMLKDNEIEDAYSLAEYAYLVGVDALILQDVGLSYLIHKRLPKFDIHASTQMSVHSPAALKFLKEMGFSRVVVAREMSRDELIAFCKAAKELSMTVEVFIHGALCMCVSGQCLLSAMLGSRSGNRGLCAGPCRLPFKASGGTGYDLSLKDLSLFSHIKELENMGVVSLKIEGRMKRPEYVAAATAAARQAVDTGRVETGLSNSLRDVFSRSGFTDGYFTGNLGKEMFGIRTKEDVLSANDAFSKLHELYRNERQSLGIDINVTVKSKTELKATANLGNISVCVYGDIPQKAQNKPTTKEDIVLSFSKLGGTNFFANVIDVSLDDGLFVPKSVLNFVRRELTEKLKEKLTEPPVIVKNDFTPSFSDVPHILKKIYAHFSSDSMMPKNLSGVDGVVLPLNSDFSLIPSGVTKIAELPKYIPNDNTLKEKLLKLKSQGVTHTLCGNISAVCCALECGLSVIGDRGLNIANSLSANVFSSKGLSGITISAETSLSEIKNIKCNIEKGIFAYGKIPLMVTRNCPLKNGRDCRDCDKKGSITDRMNKKFPIRCSGNYVEILNSTPIFLADRLKKIENIDYILLYFFDEECDIINNVINAYKLGKRFSCDYTRGLYYRNVL